MPDEEEHPAGREPQQPFQEDDDATRVDQNHPVDGPLTSDARTQPMPRQDATSIMPAVGRDPNWGASEAPWSGRAEVRPPRPGDYATTDWTTERPVEPRGKWWMPILVGIIALVLLALLGWGIWLITQAQDDDNPGPVAPASAAPVPTTVPTTRATTEAPETQPTTTDPITTEVTIPAVRGMSQSDAQQALARVGLSSRSRFVNSTDGPPGGVIGSDPQEGQAVPPDTVVTLIIVAEPRTTSPTPTATATQTDDDD